MATWRTVRVFISSTFRDMQAERDHLVRFVFPRLRERLLPRRIRLLDVDLRWGVTSDEDALGVCRRILDECRPRFVCMLAERYGWVPAGGTSSITAEEVLHGPLGRWPDRAHAFFYFRDPAATAAIPEAVAMSLGYREGPEPSDVATLGIEGARRRADARRRSLEDLKAAILRAKVAVSVYRPRWDPAVGRFTDLDDFGRRVFADLARSIDEDPDLADDGAAPPDEIEEEARAMEAFIEDHLGGPGAMERDGGRYVVGSRGPLLADLLAFANSRARPNVRVLTGPPGSGKSALLCALVRSVEADRGTDAPGVVSHFVGASAASTRLGDMLRRLCHRLQAEAGSGARLPEDVDELRGRFASLLLAAPAARPLLLVIDGVHALEPADGAHTLAWLPGDLPDAVRVLLSATVDEVSEEGDATESRFGVRAGVNPELDRVAREEGRTPAALAALRERREPPHETDLGPLTADDARAIAGGFLDQYRKAMDGADVERLIRKAGVGTPLYLVAALEELRTLGTREEVSARVRDLPDDLEGLLTWILTVRLPGDPGLKDARHCPVGGPLVRRFAALLAASRHGLTAEEITALVDPGDPTGNVAALQRLLRPYLRWRGETVDFNHGQFRRAARRAFLAAHSDRIAAHRALAAHFRSVADPTGDGRWQGPVPRALSELPFHQVEGHAWDDAADTIMSDRFRDASIRRLGPRRYVEQFEGLAKAAAAFPDAHAVLWRLVAEVPIDDRTRWLLRPLGEALAADVPGAARVLAVCARRSPDDDRTRVPLRALVAAHARKGADLAPDARAALLSARAALLGSRNKSVRWDAVHAYGRLLPVDSAPSLLAVADSANEHLLVRAEAARVLGRVPASWAVPVLARLAEQAPHPLSAMAARSLRRIRAVLEPENPAWKDDWTQPDRMPPDEARVLREIGFRPESTGSSRADAGARLLLHVMGSNTLTVEERWREIEILDHVLRRLPCRLVCTESGSRDCSLTPLREIAPLAVWEDVAGRYVHDFRLGAEEYLQLTTLYDFRIWGVEDRGALMGLLEAKRSGLDARKQVESPERARAMTRNCLDLIDRLDSRVTVLLTQFLTGRQIRCVLEREGAAANLRYASIALAAPIGDVFEMDANFVHSL